MKRLAAVVLVAAGLAGPASAQSVIYGSIFEMTCAYPSEAQGATGDVNVAFMGTEQGGVSDIVIERSSGNPDLDKAAVNCVAMYRFDPKGPLAVVNKRQHHALLRWGPDATGTRIGKFMGRSHVCRSPHPVPEPPPGTGVVTTVAFTITEQGTVRDPRIAVPSGIDVLDADALECVRGWFYSPAMKDGAPIAVPWKAEVVWRAPSAPK
jgi:TonB family protein